MEDSSTDLKPEGRPPQGTDAADHTLTSSCSEQHKERDQPRNGKSSSSETTTQHARSRVHEEANPTVKGYSASRATLPPNKAFATTSAASSAAASIATSFVNEAPMSRELATAERPPMERASKLTPRAHLQSRSTQQDDHCVTGRAASRGTPATFYSSQERARNQPPQSVNKEVSVPHNRFRPKQPKKRRLEVAQGDYDREQHAAARWESTSARSFDNQGASSRPEEFQAGRPGQSAVIASSNSLPIGASPSIGNDQDALARAILFGSHYGSHAPGNDTSRTYSQSQYEQEQRKQRFVPAARASPPRERGIPVHDPRLSRDQALINNILGQSINARTPYRSTMPSSSTSLVSAIQKQQARHAALSASNEQHLIGEVLRRKIHQNDLLSHPGVLGRRSAYNSDIPPSLPRSLLTEPRHALPHFASIGMELSSVPTYDSQIQDVLRQQDTLRSAQSLMRLSDRQALERESLGSSLLQYPTSSTVDVSRTAHDPGSPFPRIGLPETALHFDNQTDSSSRRKRELSGYEVAGPLSSRNGDFQPEEPIVIPPCQEGPLPHHLRRNIVPLSAIQDKSWLSEFLCFVRSDLFEIFRASREDVASRNNSRQITYQQIGIRCRFCAHLPHEDRASRSSTFPSSLDRIYQSVIMIIREHFAKCNQIPETTMAQFVYLKEGQCKGITGSSKYWADAARRKGLVDTPNGIRFDESLIQPASRASHLMSDSRRGHAQAATAIAPANFPATSGMLEMQNELIVEPSDRQLVSDYLYTLMAQLQRISLKEADNIGKGMVLGMPGLGCRHCRQSNGHFFPPRRRFLSSRIKSIHRHLMQCELCPMDIRKTLDLLERQDNGQDVGDRRAFLDRIWARLHGGIPPGIPADYAKVSAKTGDV